MPTPTYDLISTTTLTSTVSSVTLSSIPQTYRDLILIVDTPSTASGTCLLYPNDDYNNNVTSSVNMNGDGSSATSSSVSNGNGFQILFGGQAQAITHIFDYATTNKHKAILHRQSRPGSQVRALAGRWGNTDAITFIVLANANLTSGTQISLYGIVS